MTDASNSPADAPEPSPEAALADVQAHELEVDLGAFLPEGVELAGGDDGGPDDVAEPPAVAEVPPASGSAAPAADLEALSQIERDLDAVDAAIAALDAGTYGIDSATGQPIDDALLAENPTRLS